ncbi:MAG: LytTR family transcriptional regulator [Clostridia bacterium]|nr:LytTR family transcriptional regulator [Clostridia bacterium]
METLNRYIRGKNAGGNVVMGYQETRQMTIDANEEYYNGNTGLFFSYMHPKVVMISIGEGQIVEGKENLKKVYGSSIESRTRYMISDMSCKAYPVSARTCFTVLQMELSSFHPDGSMSRVNQRTTVYWNYFRDLAAGTGEKRTGWFIMNIHVSIGLKTDQPMISFEHLSENIRSNIIQQMDTDKRMTFHDQNGAVNYISPIEIVYIKADKIHCDIWTGRDKKIVVRRYIAQLEAELGEEFFRSHKSYLVNLRYVKAIQNRDLILSNDIVVPVSRRQLPKIKELLEKMKEK